MLDQEITLIQMSSTPPCKTTSLPRSHCPWWALTDCGPLLWYACGNICWMLVLFKTIRSALQHGMPYCARARTHTAFLFQSYSFVEAESIALLVCKAYWALTVMTGNVKCNCAAMPPFSISHSLVSTPMSLIYKWKGSSTHHTTPQLPLPDIYYNSHATACSLVIWWGRMWDCGKEQQRWALSQRVMSAENRHIT